MLDPLRLLWEVAAVKRLMLCHCLKLLMCKIVLWSCLVSELLSLFPAFCILQLACADRIPFRCFPIAAAQHRHFGALSPYSESLLIPASRLPGLVPNAPSPLDWNRKAFSPIAKGWLLMSVPACSARRDRGQAGKAAKVGLLEKTIGAS